MADHILEVSGLGLFRDNCLRKIYVYGQRRLSSLKITAMYKKLKKKKLYIKKKQLKSEQNSIYLWYF